MNALIRLVPPPIEVLPAYHRCSCGRVYTAAEWASLTPPEAGGIWEIDDEETLELRNCAGCGSTMAHEIVSSINLKAEREARFEAACERAAEGVTQADAFERAEDAVIALGRFFKRSGLVGLQDADTAGALMLCPLVERHEVDDAIERIKDQLIPNERDELRRYTRGGSTSWAARERYDEVIRLCGEAWLRLGVLLVVRRVQRTRVPRAALALCAAPRGEASL